MNTLERIQQIYVQGSLNYDFTSWITDYGIRHKRNKLNMNKNYPGKSV
jgi:hypothetical protein